jgi:hypothetical protein
MVTLIAKNQESIADLCNPHELIVDPKSQPDIR